MSRRAGDTADRVNLDLADEEAKLRVADIVTCLRIGCVSVQLEGNQ